MIKVEIDVIIMSKTTQVNIYVYVDVFLGSLGVISMFPCAKRSNLECTKLNE